MLRIICFILVLIGLSAFAIGIAGPQAKRVWQAYLVNFVFWSGISYGSVLFVAVLNMTNAVWARPLKRLAEAPGAFLPALFLLFLGLYFGRNHLFPWIDTPVHGKEVWLNVDSLFVRDGAGLFLLSSISLSLIYFSVRGDIDNFRQKQISQGIIPASTYNCSLVHKATQRGWRAQVVLSPIFGILYALVLSLVAFDLIMSLDPHWTSTLFGAYYFIGSFYTALAMLVILTAFKSSSAGLKDYISNRHFHDFGKLLLGFCLLTGDFFYSQFLVIWYGNLPEETKYVILRVRQSPWEPLAWAVLTVCFLIPFVILLSRKVKMKPKPMIFLSVLILIGMWFERFLLIAPSLWKGQTIPFGFEEVFISAGYFGGMGLTIIYFLNKFPLLPYSDPLFGKLLEVRNSEANAR